MLFGYYIILKVVAVFLLILCYCYESLAIFSSFFVVVVFLVVVVFVVVVVALLILIIASILGLSFILPCEIRSVFESETRKHLFLAPAIRPQYLNVGVSAILAGNTIMSVINYGPSYGCVQSSSLL